MAWDDFPSQKGGGPAGGRFGKNEPPFDFPKLNLPEFKPDKIFLLGGLVLLLWLASSAFFVVGPDEEGVVLRFGRYVRTVSSGLNWKLPSPIETVFTPKVTKIRREEIGFRLIDQGPPARYRDIPEESLMVTGDENIIDIDLVVQYQISDAADYLFNVRRVRKAVRDASEAAIRAIIGGRGIDEALTGGKLQIQVETKDLIQSILNRYRTGLKVNTVQLQDVHPPKQVVEAFKDVVSAREDKERMVNEAQGYQKMIIPETRGKVAKIVRTAEGYREAKIDRAKGDTAKFLKVLEEYSKAEDITRKRLYIEMMEKVLGKVRKVIVGEKSGGGVIPLFPLSGDGRILGEAPQTQKK